MRNMKYIHEALETPVRGEYDVIVCGGGVAGVSAAVSAGRMGARVLLLEKAAVLGGLATLGLISWYEPICDGQGRRVMGGMTEELMELSIRYGFDSLPEGWRGSKTSDEARRCATHFSHTIFSLALLELCESAGVELLFDTAVVSAMTADGRISGVVVENKDGRGFYGAKMVVDATGDADVALRCDVPCEDGESFFTYIAYRADAECARKVLETQDMRHSRAWQHIGANLWGKGHPEDMPTFHGIDAKSETLMLAEGQRRLLDSLRTGERNAREITALPGMAQYRKTRRIVGACTLTEQDQGKSFPDSVGVAGDFVHRGILYELPYRMLYSAQVENLFAAGRIVSSTGWAWDVTRVIPVAVATGQAAGIAAALCAGQGLANAALDVAQLQAEMARTGVTLHIDEL